MSFEKVEKRFKEAHHTRDGDGDWESPYRLLAGAAYSIGCAYCLYQKPGINPTFPLSPDWRDVLLGRAKTASLDEGEPHWWPVWAASYMLTNAIFRVAAATEKILGLIGNDLSNGRDVMGKLKASSTVAAGVDLPKAHEYLRHYPAREKGASDPHAKRKKLLHDQRENYDRNRVIDSPLVCAIIQHDSDKHVPYPPEKDLDFDFELAVSAFNQACDVWDEAYNAGIMREGTRAGKTGTGGARAT